MELIVPLNVQGGRPLYEQIYQYIKDEIRKGNIRPEKQLPSSRELATLRRFREKAILRRHWTESFRRWRSLLLPGRIRKKSCLWA